MRLFFLSFVSLILSAALLIHFTLPEFNIPQEALPWLGVALVFLGMTLQLEGVFSVKKLRDVQRQIEDSKELTKTLKESQEAHKRLKSDHKQVEHYLKDAQKKLRHLEDRIKLGQEREKTLESQEHGGVINLLALLQEKGRLIDFLQDDITAYEDADVGAAARIVHQGCAEVLKDFFDIKPVSEKSEGAAITIDAAEHSRRFRLLGQGSKTPPFKGQILHRGWTAKAIKLPKNVSKEAHSGMISPVQVELV